MPRLRPDPTFYPSPNLAAEAPPEELAYVALLAPEGIGKTDALAVVDGNADSPSYGKLVGKLDFPDAGNELHHFGWNACSSHLCPYAPPGGRVGDAPSGCFRSGGRQMSPARTDLRLIR